MQIVVCFENNFTFILSSPVYLQFSAIVDQRNWLIKSGIILNHLISLQLGNLVYYVGLDIFFNTSEIIYKSTICPCVECCYHISSSTFVNV